MIPKEPAIRALRTIEHVGLAIIVVATLLAVGQELWVMVKAMHVRLADLLMLFIYLEIIAMVTVYFECHRLPVRFPLYIGIVAMARYIILDAKAMSHWQLLAVAGTILLLAITVLIVRFGHIRFPYSKGE